MSQPQVRWVWIGFMLSLSVLFSPGVPTRSATPSSVVNLAQDQKRLFEYTSSPFAVLVFREDALGNHIGIVYYGTMGAPLDGSWKLDDRFWQNEDWSSDVTSFAWASSGRALYIATGPIYGTGSVYRLHLQERRVELVFSPDRDGANALKRDEIYTPEIVAVDEEKGLLTVRFSPDVGQEVRTLQLPMH